MAWWRARNLNTLQHWDLSLLLTDGALVPHILDRYRSIKDALIAFSSLQKHTTLPLAHHPQIQTRTVIKSAMCPNFSSFFVVPSCQCATTVAAHSFFIPVGTAFHGTDSARPTPDPQQPRYKYMCQWCVLLLRSSEVPILHLSK